MLNGYFDSEKSDLFKPKNAQTRYLIIFLIFLIVILFSIILVYGVFFFIPSLFSNNFIHNIHHLKGHGAEEHDTHTDTNTNRVEILEQKKPENTEEDGEWTYEIDTENNSHNNNLPPPQPIKNNPKQPTIFVSLASYRDTECLDTIKDMFKKAKYPENVFLGVAEQNKFGNESCLDDEILEKYSKQIRSVHIPAAEAKGPCLGRFLTSLLYRDEDYFFQADSHLIWIQNWDEVTIGMFQRCPSKKCVFSHYTPDQPQYGTSITDVPILCRVFFNIEDVIAFRADTVPKKTDGKFFPSPVTAAGFLVGPGIMIKEVPYDPYLDFLFTGEEILHSARLWTSGYDFYVPSENIVFHHYGRANMPKIWGDPEVHYNGAWAQGKVKYFFKQDADPSTTAYAQYIPEYEKHREKYGMGNVRTIEDYHAFAGIDCANRKTISRKKFCDREELENLK